MRIVSADLYALRIPFKIPFSHSLMTRGYSDSVVVRLNSDSGESGYGEGLPRPYVTGETVSTSFEYIQRYLLPQILRNDPGQWELKADPLTLLSEIDNILPDEGNGSVIAFHAAKAAVEVALVELLLKRGGISLGNLIRPAAQSVTYSAVITSDSADNVRKIALKCREYGIRQIKIKVGTGDDYGRVSAIRDALGESISLRVDANGAFDVKNAIKLISSIQPFKIDSIEQPVPRGDANDLAQVRKNSPIPVMADESLITEEDATVLIEKAACDLFNLRISKNGGIFKTLRLATMARNAGVGFQLGCLVGETAILSAAGRHLAAHLKDAMFVEGSYGTFLLQEDIAEEPVLFDYAGKAPLLNGTGLGIRVREDLLQKYSERTIRVDMK